MADVVLDLKKGASKGVDVPSRVALDPKLVALLESRIIEEADKAMVRDGSPVDGSYRFDAGLPFSRAKNPRHTEASSLRDRL
jgi:hypothetical protein